MEEEFPKIDWNLRNLATDEKREKIDSQLDEIKRRRGEIISESLEIEELLEGILTNYFIMLGSDKSQFFEVEVMKEMKFDNKIQLFSKILRKENYNKEKSDKIILTIRDIQLLRNKAAHWRTLAFLQRGEVRLRKKNEISIEEMFSLDDNIMKKFKEDKNYIFQDVIAFYQWLWDKNLKVVNENFKEYIQNNNFEVEVRKEEKK